MPTDIHRNDVRRMVAGGAQLVEVLSQSEYEEGHLPGAINIPLRKLDLETAALLQKNQPILTYCHDYQ